MKKTIIAVVCILFAACVVICGDVLAQRSVNSANEAAQKAKASLMTRSGGSSSQIEWLNSVVNTINMNPQETKENSGSEKTDTNKN